MKVKTEARVRWSLNTRIKFESIVESVKGVDGHMRMNVKLREDLRTFDSMKTLGQEYEAIVNEKPTNVLHSPPISGFGFGKSLIFQVLAPMKEDCVILVIFPLKSELLPPFTVLSEECQARSSSDTDILVWRYSCQP
ncbi:hypothetical protein P5673_018279 [Acropora cervicornis]|uniref:Uncharacterized protein n=1 Tax=Acropora cervicornis TaxID=6130 RepID=A0AAD9QDB1_ACRCE|nr:hypothetical protein P5673_018279 [Acropora cervicornis]